MHSLLVVDNIQYGRGAMIAPASSCTGRSEMAGTAAGAAGAVDGARARTDSNSPGSWAPPWCARRWACRRRGCRALRRSYLSTRPSLRCVKKNCANTLLHQHMPCPISKASPGCLHTVPVGAKLPEGKVYTRCLLMAGCPRECLHTVLADGRLSEASVCWARAAAGLVPGDVPEPRAAAAPAPPRD